MNATTADVYLRLTNVMDMTIVETTVTNKTARSVKVKVSDLSVNEFFIYVAVISVTTSLATVISISYFRHVSASSI